MVYINFSVYLDIFEPNFQETEVGNYIETQPITKPPVCSKSYGQTWKVWGVCCLLELEFFIQSWKISLFFQVSIKIKYQINFETPFIMYLRLCCSRV